MVNSKQLCDRTDVKRPKIAQSGANGIGPIRTRPRTERFSFAQAVEKYKSLDVEGMRSMRVKQRIGKVNSECKKSSTSSAGPKRARLRSDGKGPENTLSGTSGDRSICSLLVAGNNSSR